MKLIIENKVTRKEAVQFTGNFDEVEDFVGGDLGKDKDGNYVVATLEGAMKVSPNDFIIKGLRGEFYPCKPDIFKASYNVVEMTESFLD